MNLVYYFWREHRLLCHIGEDALELANKDVREETKKENPEAVDQKTESDNDTTETVDADIQKQVDQRMKESDEQANAIRKQEDDAARRAESLVTPEQKPETPEQLAARMKHNKQADAAANVTAEAATLGMAPEAHTKVDANAAEQQTVIASKSEPIDEPVQKPDVKQEVLTAHSKAEEPAQNPEQIDPNASVERQRIS
jgi:hypothetical protein